MEEEGTFYTAGELAGGTFTKKEAFLVQEDTHRDILLHSCSKRVSTTSSHCGFESWSSSEGPSDRVYQKTAVSVAECLSAVNHHEYVDSQETIHRLRQEGEVN